MRQRALTKLFIAIIGGLSIGAHGSPCGTCPPTYTTTVPLLPKANGDGGFVDAGNEPLDCTAACGSAPISCNEVHVDGGPPLVECVFAESCGAGRRTRGHRQVSGVGRDETGAWLAATAALEAQSVHAFSRLARELEGFGAPKALITRAGRARADEVRHATTMRKLAAERRGRPSRTRRPRERVRTLLEIAVENAVEGCVREAFGALVAHHQARHAGDEKLRRAMRTIAREETAHAALAFDVHAWLLSKLTPRERADVRANMMRAAQRLESETNTPLARATLTTTGLPSSAHARELARAMVAALL